MRIQPIQLAADGLAHTPLDTVARHGLAERAGRRETNVGTVRLRFAYAERGEERATEAATVVVNPSEIFGSQQADTFRKTWDGLPLGADREFFAPARTPAGEYRPSVLSFHTGAESVRFGAVAIIRLKGAFRHSYSIL